ncbi:hypothetical protein RHMOL_Rhmol12G0013700 [Rhododendron molle]|uniref:Uncharacterized protein n=1 Tax=Rhododendron molle TaxID=49168 RepID=A0ACC0LE83_RHOML|nr:hypothetical protein RHMOL_Rhmol12G0013700 [Rhododendron molle]
MGKSKLKVLIQKRVQKLDLEEALVVYPGTAFIPLVFWTMEGLIQRSGTLSQERKDEGSDVIAEGLDTLENMANELNEYVMIVLKGSEPMAFGETEEPAAYGELVSIGGLTPDVNKKLSAAISAILETKLSVPKSRFLLKF